MQIHLSTPVAEYLSVIATCLFKWWGNIKYHTFSAETDSNYQQMAAVGDWEQKSPPGRRACADLQRLTRHRPGYIRWAYLLIPLPTFHIVLTFLRHTFKHLILDSLRGVRRFNCVLGSLSHPLEEGSTVRRILSVSENAQNTTCKWIHVNSKVHLERLPFYTPSRQIIKNMEIKRFEAGSWGINF